MKGALAPLICGCLIGVEAARRSPVQARAGSGCEGKEAQTECASAIAHAIVGQSRECFKQHFQDEAGYKTCTHDFCNQQCGSKFTGCQDLCSGHANGLFTRFAQKAKADKAHLEKTIEDVAGEEAAAMQELVQAQGRMRDLNVKIAARAQKEIQTGNAQKGKEELAKMNQLSKLQDQIDQHLANVRQFRGLAQHGVGLANAPSFLQSASGHRLRRRAPEDELAQEMTHDLEMNFNKIAPFGKEDTAKELQDHAAKTQDTLVDAVENAEVAEIKRAVFRALTRLRAATIKEFDTIARLETQAIDAYNDAHHYRAENPLAHLHEDEAPVETDKLKSFH